MQSYVSTKQVLPSMFMNPPSMSDVEAGCEERAGIGGKRRRERQAVLDDIAVAVAVLAITVLALTIGFPSS